MNITENLYITLKNLSSVIEESYDDGVDSSKFNSARKAAVETIKAYEKNKEIASSIAMHPEWIPIPPPPTERMDE